MKKAAPFLLLLGAFVVLHPAALAQNSASLKFAFFPQANAGAPLQPGVPELLLSTSAGGGSLRWSVRMRRDRRG